jgi:hypothetical protein
MGKRPVHRATEAAHRGSKYASHASKGIKC